jgi:hypothetical protein
MFKYKIELRLFVKKLRKNRSCARDKWDHGMARRQFADGGTASSSCEYIE